MQQLLQQQANLISAMQHEIARLTGGSSSVPHSPQSSASHGSYKFMAIEDFRALPDKIFLVRHAQSVGNLDHATYSSIPDYEVSSNMVTLCVDASQHTTSQW